MPLHIIRQDITKMAVDAIVNTTNEEMIGYSGVDLAVHTAAGADMEAACAALAPLGLGEAKLTRGYALPARYVIHTASPDYQDGLQGERAILRACYEESLRLAVAKGCETVAFPLIGTGFNGYPKEKVLPFAVAVISDFLRTHEMTVYLCVFDARSYEFSRHLYREISSFIDDEYASFCVDNAIPYRPVTSDFCCDCFEMPSHVSRCAMEEPPRRRAQAYAGPLDKGFAETLFELIDARGLTDVECYKRANVDKRIFSKIKSNPDYRPSKKTALAFAVALHLTIEETQVFLAKAGFALTGSRRFDKIVSYFINNGIYDIFEINQALFEFDEELLGSL